MMWVPSFSNPFAHNGNSSRPSSPTRLYNWVTRQQDQQQEQQQELEQSRTKQERERRQREEQEEREEQDRERQREEQDREQQLEREELEEQQRENRQKEREKQQYKQQRFLEHANKLKQLQEQEADDIRKWQTVQSIKRNTDTVSKHIVKRVLHTVGIIYIESQSGVLTLDNPKSQKVMDVIMRSLPPDTYLTSMTKMDDPLYTTSVKEVANVIRLRALSYILNSTTDEPYNGYNQLNLRSPTVQITTGGAVGTVGTLVHNQIFCRPQNTSIQPNDDALYALFPTFMLGTHKLVYSIGPIVRDRTRSQIIGRTLIMIRVYNYKVHKYPDGFYFWAYPSNSEGGMIREFLKQVDPGGIFFKGLDYLVTSLINDLLQAPINMAVNAQYHETEITPELLLDFCRNMPCIHLRGIQCYVINSDDLNVALTQGMPDPVERGKITVPLMMCFTATALTDSRSSRVLQFSNSNDTREFHKFDQPQTLFTRWDETTLVQGNRVYNGEPSLAACVLSGAPSFDGLKYNPYLRDRMGDVLSINMEKYRVLAPVHTFNDYIPYNWEQDPHNLGPAKFRMKQELVELRPADRVFHTTGRAIPRRRLVTFPVPKNPAERFNALPKAIRAMCKHMFERIYSAALGGVDPDLKFCFDSFLGLDPARNFNTMPEFETFIVSEFKGFDDEIPQDGGSSDMFVSDDSRLHRLMKMVEFGTYRYALMRDIFTDFINSHHSNIYNDSIYVECSYLMSTGNYSPCERKSMNAECNFSHLFTSAGFDPYIFKSQQQTRTFTDGQLRDFTLNPLRHPTLGISVPDADIKKVTVYTQTFFIKLVFYGREAASRNPNYGGIQMIVTVSSLMSVHSDPPIILSGVDVQFGIIFIGPVRVVEPEPGTGDVPDLFADATVLATMADYLSLGCIGTSKMAEYTITVKSQQFIAPIDDHFKILNTLCREYVFTYISPANSKHDIVMRLFRDAFDGDHQTNRIIEAITSKWRWDLVTLQSITNFRKRMATVLDILVSPALYIIYSRRQSSKYAGGAGQKTVKRVKKYRYNTSKSRPNKSKPKPKTKSMSKPRPKSKSNLKCKRRMNMNTATRRRCRST